MPSAARLISQPQYLCCRTTRIAETSCKRCPLFQGKCGRAAWALKLLGGFGASTLCYCTFLADAVVRSRNVMTPSCDCEPIIWLFLPKTGQYIDD